MNRTRAKQGKATRPARRRPDFRGRRAPARPSDLSRGQEALARGDWDGARARFASALAAGETAEGLEGLGWALWWLDDAEGSFERRERAFGLFRRRGEPRAAARVATGLALDAFDLLGPAATSGWLERGRSLLAGAELCPEHGWLALWEGHFARLVHRDLGSARALASEAASIARAHGLADLELLASALEGLIMVSEGKVPEGMRRLDEATAAAVAGEIAELDAVAAACCFFVYACERVRDYERAAVWGERIEALCRRWRVPTLFALCRTQHAAMLIGRGEWAKAEVELEQVQGILETRRPLLTASALVRLGELRRRQGRFAEAGALFSRSESEPLASYGRGWIALDRGDATSAADLASRFLRNTAPDNWTGLAMGFELLVQALAVLGPRAEADRASREIEALSARIDAPWLRATARLAAGALALAAGDHDSARPALEDAVDQFERCGSPFEAVRSRLALARALAGLGRTGLAHEEATRAHTDARRLGASFEAGCAEALVAGLRSGRPAPEGRQRGALTRRETEVLNLLAKGLGDKEVAARLRLSEHTIHRHVANVLTKLDVPTRVAAVAHAIRLGLL